MSVVCVYFIFVLVRGRVKLNLDDIDAVVVIELCLYICDFRLVNSRVFESCGFCLLKSKPLTVSAICRGRLLRVVLNCLVFRNFSC